MSHHIVARKYTSSNRHVIYRGIDFLGNPRRHRVCSCLGLPPASCYGEFIIHTIIVDVFLHDRLLPRQAWMSFATCSFGDYHSPRTTSVRHDGYFVRLCYRESISTISTNSFTNFAGEGRTLFLCTCPVVTPLPSVFSAYPTECKMKTMASIMNEYRINPMTKIKLCKQNYQTQNPCWRDRRERRSSRDQSGYT